MRRLPVIATTVVALAVATMIALGVWQLDRLREKEAALTRYAANMTLPATAYPRSDPTDATYLFRRLSATCLRVVRWQVTGGRLADDRPGWRHIASCATGAEGPGLVVDMGVAADPAARPDWSGGPVEGIATWEPVSTSALGQWLGNTSPPRLMIVADTPAPGLAPSPRPDPAGVPNNHLAYAVQWFLFAGIAVIIYGLVLRRRLTP